MGLNPVGRLNIREGEKGSVRYFSGFWARASGIRWRSGGSVTLLRSDNWNSGTLCDGFVVDR